MFGQFISFRITDLATNIYSDFSEMHTFLTNKWNNKLNKCFSEKPQNKWPNLSFRKAQIL